MDHPSSPLCALGWSRTGQTMPLPALDDAEGERLPALLPPVVDAHVHLFPDGVFEAIWRWFDQYGWPIRYKLHCHVQCFSADEDRMEPIYAACESFDRPLVMHAGREPASAQYEAEAALLGQNALRLFDVG
ncbi:MAG: hypothetical protein WBV82_03245 [Myxococcaceae bacterium]